MKDSRLIELFRTFNEEEIKSLSKFLNSPFLKPPRNTISLFSYITKFHPDYDSKKLEKENVFQKLFTKEDYNEKKLVNLMSDLSKAAEDFLAYSTLKIDEIEFLLNLSKGYLSKKLTKQAMRIAKIVEKKLVPGFSPSKDYISKFRRLTYIKSAYYTETNDFNNLIECKKNYFEALIVQFIIDYTQIISSKEPISSTYGKDVENQLIESMLKSFDIEKLFKQIEKSDSIHTPLISLQYYSLKLAEKPEELNNYFLLKEIFYKNISKLDREEKYFIFNDLLNYCTQRFFKRDENFVKEGLEVYKKMLEENAFSFSENEPMQVLIYRNIIHFCNVLKETEWLEYFIKNYSGVLSSEYREDMENLAYGNLYFSRKEFEKALVRLSKINHEFFIFKSDLKILLLKIYFEIDSFESAFSMVDTYKHFLSNTKEISEPNKKVFHNFLLYYHELLKIKSGQHKEHPSILKLKIEKENNIVNKSWLIEKVKEL